ncbi:MAG: pyrroline-5-carboxylate reductase [Betaproteobacteria bacterium]
MTIAFIGGGNMATALIGGLTARGRAAADMRVVEPYPEARARIEARHAGVKAFAECTGEAVAGAGLVVLAVKPQQMRDAARALGPHLAGTPGPVVLSIAAGIRLADLARWLGGHRRLVRAMPNMPALVGRGISGIYAEPEVDADGRALAVAVVEAAGEVVWVATEAMLDAVTGISGSGPAYVFYFLEALEEAARDLGFCAADARRLAYATVAGSVALAQASTEPPAALRRQVTSKAGTTERALAVLDAGAVKGTIIEAAKAAALRAAELGDTFSGDS